MRSIIYLMLIGLSVLIQAQSIGKQSLAQLEESPAGSRILWFMDIIQKGEDVSDEEVKQNFSPKLIDKMGFDKLKDTFSDILENDGTLFIYEAKRKKMTEYKLRLMGEKSGEWLEMQFFFEDSNPYRMLGFTLDSTDGPLESGEPIYPTKN
ncbi:hypothetical protein [Ekhidna sp. To15]|uniref:hypothetical protein n=1 Tax=Ekhidna sp. To15 TaxID=3395267 RepID=UPI003F51FBF5